MTTSPEPGLIPQLTLGWRLRMARATTGLSTRDFAERIGVSHGTITNAENDKRSVRPITLNAYALATGVDRTWLETGVVTGDTPDGTEMHDTHRYRPSCVQLKTAHIGTMEGESCAA